MATPSEQLIARRGEFHAALHGWYRVHQRRLPWRDAPSLYKTVVSEFMLQQTQVATVLPYFDRWLRALPDFAALAAASETKVLKLWEGLGYYSRARNLHKLAQAVVARATPPRTPAGWRELPGIGPYTAAAITSISFGEPIACVDGNVVRILARLTGEARLFRDGSEAAKHFAPLASGLINGANPRGAAKATVDPGEHNQAMMELGATVCFRAKPLCLTCPVAGFCAARRRGEPEKFPRLKPKRLEQDSVIRILCLDRGRVLLRLGAPGAKRLAGVHELPEAGDLGVQPTAETLLATKRRTITRFQITESIHRLRLDPTLRARIAADSTLEWVKVGEFDRVTLSGPHKRWLAELLPADEAR